MGGGGRCPYRHACPERLCGREARGVYLRRPANGLSRQEVGSLAEVDSNGTTQRVRGWWLRDMGAGASNMFRAARDDTGAQCRTPDEEYRHARAVAAADTQLPERCCAICDVSAAPMPADRAQRGPPIGTSRRKTPGGFPLAHQVGGCPQSPRPPHIKENLIPGKVKPSAGDQP